MLQKHHGERSRQGRDLRLRISGPWGLPREAAYSVVEPLSTGDAVADFGEGLERRETVVVAVESRLMEGLPRPLPMSATVLLPGDKRAWALDQQRGVEYGPRVVLRLARKPLEEEAEFRSAPS